MEYEEAKKEIYKLLEDFIYTPLMSGNIKEGIAIIKEKTNCDDQTAKLIWCDLKIDYETKKSNSILQTNESEQKDKEAKKKQKAEEAKKKQKAKQIEDKQRKKQIEEMCQEKLAKEKAHEDYIYRNNAECPYCHSKNTKKIGGLSKASSVALFGIFAVGKVGKQWHCNNCKSDF